MLKSRGTNQMDEIDNENSLPSLVADLKEDEALELAHEMLDSGEDPLLILEQCQKGLFEVGKRYEKRTYFISALIMGGEIMNRASNLVLSMISDAITCESGGLILLGTVEGDIHNLGKDLFKVMAQCHGFTVHDLGVDVPPQDFLNAVKDSNPEVVGLSSLLQAGYDKMKATIELFRENIPRPEESPAYIIGGLVDEMVCAYTGSDYWTRDAMEGVRICQRIIKDKGE
jgi:methanogenic corrinoid protein MtbC1